jgi:hypothetical protein
MEKLKIFILKAEFHAENAEEQRTQRREDNEI